MTTESEMSGHDKGFGWKRAVAILCLLALAGLGATLLLTDDEAGWLGEIRQKIAGPTLGTTSPPAVLPDDGSILPVDDRPRSTEIPALPDDMTGVDVGNVVNPPVAMVPPTDLHNATGSQEAEGGAAGENTGAYIFGQYRPATPSTDGTSPRNVYSANSGEDAPDGQEQTAVNDEGLPPEPVADRVERAITEAAAPREVKQADAADNTANHTAITRDTPPPPDGGRRGDSVVTQAFVDELALWLVASYRPASGESASPGTAASLAGANARFGSRLTGLRHGESSPQQARQVILNHVYTPGMLDALQRMYGQQLVAAIKKCSREPAGEHGPLSASQQADMFTVYSGIARHLAASLRGVNAVEEMPARLADIERTNQAVSVASTAFAESLYAYEAAKEDGDTSAQEKHRLEMIERSANSELVLERQAQARAALTNDIKRRVTGGILNDDALVYLAQWVNRRGAGKTEATSMAATVIDRVADQFAEEAGRLRTQAR